MSRYKEYVPNERIVDRAVALWMTMLGNPKYDNLGEDSPESPQSIFANKMSSAIAAAIPNNNTKEVITRFGDELRKILMTPLEWESEAYGNQPAHKYTTMFDRLSVDYHPDIPLKAAAKRAGLEMEFPWKTSMFLTADYLYLAYGYGSPAVYHYPLKNDDWLVTTLCGGDMNKIIALVESGKITTELTCPTNP